MVSAVAARADGLGLGQRRRGGLSVVDELIAPAPRMMLPLDQLAGDPGNVRDDMGDIPGLASSIAEHGIFLSLVVCTVEAYNRAHPAAPVLETGCTHVALDGNRRRLAATEARLATVPVEVHDEWAGLAKTSLQMVTAMHAQRLSPVAFAEGIRELRARHQLRQQDVGRYLGLKLDQATVSRYEKLLGYPTYVKDLLRQEAVTMEAAKLLASLAEHAGAMQRAYALMTCTDDMRLDARSAVETIRHEVATEANAATSRRRLAAAGTPVVDPAAEWGSKAALHLLAHDDLPRATEREHKGCLAAAVSTDDGLIDWYCLDPARHGILDDAAESRRARDARQRYVTKMVATWPGAPAAGYELADGLIAAARPGTAARLAVGWAKDSGLLPPEVTDRDLPEVLDWVTWRLAGEARVRFARLLTVAGDEVAVRALTEWGPRQRAYIARLQDVDHVTPYAPTPWEHDRINRIEAAEALA